MDGIDTENQDGSINVMKDGGTILVFGILTLFFITLLFILSKCDKILHSDYRVYRFYMKSKQKIFFNSIIRYFMASAIKLQNISLDILCAGFLLSFFGIG